jgi:nucleoid-associated protein YgaU
MNVVAASRPRCLAVALGLTATLWGAAALLVRMLAAGQPVTPEDALVRLCLGALALAAAWAWLQAMGGVAEAWRGASRATHLGVRRLALAACGVALTGALTAPAHAGIGAGSGTDGPRADPLSGLPFPERAEGPAHPRRGTVVVHPGDTLWAIAERDLPAPATDRQVSVRWQAVYRRNRAVIGPDPDLIRPGQVLSVEGNQE